MDAHTSAPTAEERAKLLKAISTLTGREATLILRHYLKNESLEEIAQSLDLTPDEVAATHYSALIALRSYKR